jgi:hypothetical protein
VLPHYILDARAGFLILTASSAVSLILNENVMMNASRLLVACALLFSGTGQAQTSTADTDASQSISVEANELVIDPQGMAIDLDATVRDPIRGERSY